MRRALHLVLGLALLGAVACGSDTESRAGSGAARVGTPDLPPLVASVFDTLSWSSHAQLISRGEEVYDASCKKCHGPTGAGEGGYIYGGQTYQPPSFLVASWRFANDPMALRQYVYSGSVAGMPYWGLAGVSYRDLDAVSAYILDVLRPSYGDRANSP